MVESEFENAISAKTVGSSHGDFGLVIEALHDAAGYELLSAEIVQDQLPMLPQRAGDFLEGLDTGVHGLAAPLIQELAGPSRRVVIPELLKGFLEEVSRDGFQVITKEVAEPKMLFVAEVLVTAEE